MTAGLAVVAERSLAGRRVPPRLAVEDWPISPG